MAPAPPRELPGDILHFVGRERELAVLSGPSPEPRARAELEDPFATGDDGPDLRAVLSWSYEDLEAQTRRVLRLVGGHLVDQTGAERFRLHELVKTDAAERMELLDPLTDQEASVDAMLSWYLHSREVVKQEGAEVLRPLFDPRTAAIPDCLSLTASMVSMGPVTEISAETYLAMLADLHPDTLLAELAVEFGPALPGQWRPVADRPRWWIERFARVMGVLWKEFQPAWQRAETLLRRECERVGVGAVTQTMDSVLVGLSSRHVYTDGVLRLPDPHGSRYELSGRRLAFVPVVSGDAACVFELDHPGLAWVGYPLPGLGQVWGESASSAPKADALDLALGEVRARIMRLARVPRGMGELASLLFCAPATATYHCDQLAAAGLLRRERHGRHVRIRLSDRGEALLDLMA